MAKIKPLKAKDSVSFPGGKARVWPLNQEVQKLHESPTILVTKFEDHHLYAERLRQTMLDLEQNPKWTHHMHIGGSKISHVHQWETPESRLIHARAMVFYEKYVKSGSAVLDTCWGNISRDRDYLTSHSHTNSIGSLVYFLDGGDIGDDLDNLNGRFAFADPRLEYCCPDKNQPDRMVRELYLGFDPGTMLLFPSYLIHHVHPYTGNAPRITLAWNIR